MRECGCIDVPTFTQLRAKQTAIAHQLALVHSEHHKSALGNHFYMNHLSKLFALVCLYQNTSLELTNI